MTPKKKPQPTKLVNHGIQKVLYSGAPETRPHITASQLVQILQHEIQERGDAPILLQCPLGEAEEIIVQRLPAGILIRILEVLYWTNHGD